MSPISNSNGALSTPRRARFAHAGQIVTALFALACCIPTVSAAEPEGNSEFKPLFNGKDLSGWKGDADLWQVEDGVIVGSTHGKQLKQNSFLSTEKKYMNFVLKLKFKLINHNSGVQYRSEQLDDFVVKGYQADIADNQYMGILYEERGRGILANVEPENVAPHVKPGDWNEYVITADGAHLTQAINGHKTVGYQETSDEGAKEGIIALQVHTGPEMRVEFKDIEIKELP